MSQTDRAQDPIPLRRPWTSGSWADHPHMEDYRHEWFGDLLVERATWREDAPVRCVAGTQISGPGYIWFRFWLSDGGYVVEKYFDPQGHVLGIYIPVGPPIQLQGEQYRMTQLLLGLWLGPGGRVHVLGEDAFDRAVGDARLQEAEVALAERRIRELTLSIHRGQFPPPLIRNFEIRVPSDEP